MRPRSRLRLRSTRDLVQLRLEAGLTQAELAAKIGRSVSLVQKLETGERGAGPATARALARALRTTIGDLFIVNARKAS